MSTLSNRLFYVIVAGFSAVMLLVVMLMGSGYRALSSAESLIAEIVSSNDQKVAFIHNLSETARERIRLLDQMTKEHDVLLRTEIMDKYKELGKRFELNRRALEDWDSTQEEAKMLLKLKLVLNGFHLVQLEVLGALNNGDDVAAATMLLQFDGKSREFDRVLMQYSALEDSLRETASTRINHVFGESLSRMLVFSVLIFVVGFLVLALVVHFVLKQQRKLLDMNFTLESYNHVLQLSMKESASANDAKAEFIANMNHELRTPITSIKGALGILNSGMIDSVPAEAQHLIAMADKSTDQLIELLNEVLSFSRLEAEEIEVIRKEFNIRYEIDEFLIPFYKKARNKSINFTVQFSKGLPMSVNLDHAHLFQILNQLINNAIKFTSEGDVLLKVDFKEDTDNIVFHIVDTGIGLDEDNIHHLFESFVQGDGSSTRKYGGTGIGLSICKKLVDVLEGEISVSSEQEKGSTFSFSFPVDMAA